MNFRQTREKELDVNITPLIDVVFLLLIFFMVSTTFNRETEISITLPEASAQKVESKDQPIEVVIDRNGRYYINKRQVVNNRLETLRRALAETAGDKRNVPIIISADANTPHQAVITIMDAARQIGMVKLTFAANQTQPGQ